MRKFFLISVIIICACKKKNHLLISFAKQDALKTFFNNSFKRKDSTLTLDSFRFLKLDTISLADEYADLYDFLSFMEKSKVNKMTLQNRGANGGISTSSAVFKTYKNLYQPSAQDLLKLKKEDSLLILDMKNVNNLLKNADRIKPVAYAARCFYQVRQSDMSVVRNTARIILNTHLNIIPDEEYYRQLKILYKPSCNF